MDLLAHIDGAARGNPGPAAYGLVISRDGQTLLEERGYLGHATNNVAEYTAFLRALRQAATLGATSLTVHSDSELLVKQWNGQYKVKHENLKPLFQEARRLAQGFRSLQVLHVYREANRDADRLCNQALDAAALAGYPAEPTEPEEWTHSPDSLSRPVASNPARQEAEQLLASALALPPQERPSAAQLLDQLLAVLQKREHDR